MTDYRRDEGEMSRRIVRRAKELMQQNAELLERIRAQEQAVGVQDSTLSNMAVLTWDDAVLQAMCEANEKPRL